MAKLKRHHLWIPALAMSAACLAAGAARATDCAPEHYVWELELDTLEKLDDGPGEGIRRTRRRMVRCVRRRHDCHQGAATIRVLDGKLHG